MPVAHPQRISTLAQYHRLAGLPGPGHPQLSIIRLAAMQRPVVVAEGPVSLVFDFYCIALKTVPHARFTYGQQVSDFEAGVLFFMAPGQVFSLDFDPAATAPPTGWVMLIHPDFLWNTPLAALSRQYAYFGYAVNEALHLSDAEDALLTGLVQHLEQECRAPLDKFSHGIIVSQLGTLFAYAERFYERQFITRRLANHRILDRLETLLAACFAGEALAGGLPTVAHVAGQLHLSPDYLSSVLRSLTGLNTQQHIHQKLIEKAKEKLATTGLTVSEIAFQLGFEHSQSFSKLFKTKTNRSPLEFRHSFN